MKNFYKAKNDIMFKAIFCKEENRDLLKRLLEETLNMQIEIIEVNVPELIKKNIYEKRKTLDVMVKAKEKLINIEVNTYSDKEIRNRNASYIFNRYKTIIKSGEAYNNMPDVVQINLTSESNIDLPLVSKYGMIDIENKLKYIENLKIYEFNLTKVKEKCYNKSNKYKLLSLLDCDREELKKVRGDEIVEKFKKEVETLHEDDMFYGFLTEEEEARLLKNTFINKGV